MRKKLLINNPIVSNEVFFPKKTQIPDDDPFRRVLKLKIKRKVIIGGLFYLNDPTYPTILLFHGNGEIAQDYQYSLDFFFQCEINLAVVDFRGYGFSSGKPFYTSLITDSHRVYKKFHKWLVKNGYLDSLFVFGRSLGSVCASEIGAHNPKSLRGIIFESGFASLYETMTGLFKITGKEITPEFLSKYSNDTRIRKFLSPVLIIHGLLDWIIPSYQSELIYKNLNEKVEKKLVMIKGAHHNNISSFENEYLPPLKEFIEKFK